MPQRQQQIRKKSPNCCILENPTKEGILKLRERNNLKKIQRKNELDHHVLNLGACQMA